MTRYRGTVAGRRHLLEIGGRKVAITNPEKPMYRSGFTKGQVIEYYIRISNHLLPHISQHPITLKRYPNGIMGTHFYEKDAPKFTPAWIETFAVSRRGGGKDIRYVLLPDLASLVWSANLANLEIHPFLARAPDLQQPRWMVFDLDPGGGSDVLTCAEVAFLLKAALEARGLESCAKVSGSKGVQVYVPLNTKVTYADTQPFAQALAQELERQHPDLITADMAKLKRTRKVFVDWSQNADFKSTVAVYSLRAKRDEPYVSMPFTWDEFRRAIRKRDSMMLYLDPDAAIQRLEKVGDLFRPVLDLRQRLSKQ